MWRTILVTTLAAVCQAADLQPLSIELAPSSSIQISAPSSPRLPWTVAGEHGSILGRQDGTFESWIWPVKILSHFRIAAELQDYPVPIDVNALSATIRVTPAETVITYSHAAFTVRQHAFAPRGTADPETGAAVFFEIESIRPVRLTFSFTADMLRMWPAPNFGRPDAEWVKTGSSGYYILHTDSPAVAGIVGMPGARPGIQPPYQEHPQSYPVQLLLSFDPKSDHGKVYPLLMGIKEGADAGAQIQKLNGAMEGLYQRTVAYYEHFFDARTTVTTPNREVNEAMQWAEMAVDQMQVQHGNAVGMVAGYYESADSARPGYAWFFGRDTLWTTYGINSYGDFALTRRALDFLVQRQRADGKVMHEFSQSAESLDWKTTPYFYASADATPLLVMAMWDYVRSSGDLNYLKANWEAIRKAYQFERSHDSDGDGIYENTEGTGWVESWPPGMPHQEIYLAALDQQSSEAMFHLSTFMGDAAGAQAALRTADAIGKVIDAKYWIGRDHSYAFSRNADGSLDTTASIYPSVAWWQGSYALEKAGPMLSRWAAPEFSTDWGTRDISGSSKYFDPISYHQGSVWPLFTGWVSLAEYRAGRSLSGFAHLMQNVRLTWLQDLGSATELLSGEFYQPLGRSSSHQMWSSAMIIAPLVRGLFGLQPDALQHTLAVRPHLPADWDHASVHNVAVGSTLVDLEFTRQATAWTVQATTRGAEVLCLTDRLPERDCPGAAAKTRSISVPVPAVEIAVPEVAPNQGDTTRLLKVLNEEYSDHSATFTLSAPGGWTTSLFVRKNTGTVRCDEFGMVGSHVNVRFPSGAGYQTLAVHFRW